MSVSSPSHNSTPPPALSAFLRGVERRGAVLAELQAGDAGSGDAALATAMAQFRGEAESLAMPAWPTRFWSLLLAQPQLRNRTAVALPIDVTDRLGELGSGPRAALLLRVAAGLSEDEGAAVLGVSQPSFRLALQRALPHHEDGRADPEAWQRLREQIHRRIKTLPADRLVRLSAARDAVMRGPAPASSSADAASARRRPRWLMASLWVLLATCVLALAVSFIWPDLLTPWQRALGLEPGVKRVRVEPLPEGDEPAARYSPETALVAHRDFELLADPQAQVDAGDLEFHSWYAAQQAAGVTEPAPPSDVPPADAIAPTPATGPPTGSETETESSDAP
ncbi:sigma-70 region 4 domain-containing protein [Lysobacter sp. S4-A87]|uniref:sigma-70 region 4 domain-containing protein n=1 Tax=Lysobacter sp. S4-A87 TaxID=2925843 RepID=UPI001F5345D6|nr:sigma-70 region 4 domain-containing protein [Lysobacter sp. S4-A87]UNK48489.1 sigma-70 region 4 domain-containing protein [Lysobacter sp. S4-A87]